MFSQETDDPLIKTLYKKKMILKENNGFTKSSTGMKKVRTEFHGFMVVYKKRI